MHIFIGATITQTVKAKRLIIAFTGAVLLGIAGWRLYPVLRYPCHVRFAKELSLTLPRLYETFGEPDPVRERFYGMALEASRENWDKVEELAAEDTKTILGSYFFNLANAMKGELGEHLMEHYQPFGYGLFIPVDEESSVLSIICSDEVWYQLGEMTMAEHNTILGMIFSPAQSGPRFYRRLAEINLVNGDTAAAGKYLNLLGDTLRSSWKEKRKLVQKSDFVHGATQIRPVLKGLLESNPENLPAYEYLLCHDLLTKDIAAFVRDYVPGLRECRLYQEAALIYMASEKSLNPENMSRFGVTEDVWRDFCLYSDIYSEDRGSGKRLSDNFRRTYWYYFHFAKVNEKAKRH